jgi:hypothetical protein
VKKLNSGKRRLQNLAFRIIDAKSQLLLDKPGSGKPAFRMWMTVRVGVL